MSSGDMGRGSRRRFIKTVSVGSVAGVTGLAGCLGGDSGAVPIGVLEPFTGPYSELAEERNQGERLALQQVSDSDEFDFEFAAEEFDTQADPEDGVQAANQAVDQHGADYITGAISSSVALAINEVALDRQVIYTPGAADVSITGANCNEYVFRFETSTAQVSEVMAQWTADELGDQIHYHIADYAYGQSVKEEFERRMERISDGYTEVGTTAAEFGATDFEAFITQIADASDEADALVVGSTGADLVIFLSQARDRGLHDEIPIVTTTGSFAVVRGGAGAGAYDIFSGTRYVPHLETGNNQQFVEDYQDEYDQPPDNFSRVGYGSVMMLAHGIRESDSADPEDVKDALPGLTHETIFGEVEFRECDHQATNPVWMAECVEPDEGEVADVELLRELSGEEAAPPCEETGCEL